MTHTETLKWVKNLQKWRKTYFYGFSRRGEHLHLLHPPWIRHWAVSWRWCDLSSAANSCLSMFVTQWFNWSHPTSSSKWPWFKSSLIPLASCVSPSISWWAVNSILISDCVCIRVSLTLWSLQFSFCSTSTLSFNLASRLRSCGFAFLISLASIMINGNGTKIKFSHLWPTYLSIIFIVLVSLVVCGVGLLLWKMGCWPLRDTWKAKWRILMDTSSALCNVITHQSGITVICL